MARVVATTQSGCSNFAHRCALASRRTLSDMGAAPSTLSAETVTALKGLPEAAQKEITTIANKYCRYNTLRASPEGAKYKLCVVQFKVWRRCARILVSIATECALLSRRFFAILVITGAWGQERRL